MPIDKKNIEKYIFDPENPQKCKSYKLLLNIAKEKNLVYVDTEFLTEAYEDIIVNDAFNDKLWDIPEQYKQLSMQDKKKSFINLLSRKDYINHISTLQTANYKSIYDKLFSLFFDIDKNSGRLSDILKTYDSATVKNKLRYQVQNPSRECNFPSPNINYHHKYDGRKIIFSNEIKLIKNHDAIFDISSVWITSIENNNIDLFNSLLHSHIKPIFLKDIKDVKLLLEVLQNDLKKEKYKNTETEEILSIDKIEIKDFFSIKDLQLNNLKDKKEIYILGENGDGKTLLLQSIVLALRGVEEGTVFNLVDKQNYSTNIELSNGSKLSKSYVRKNPFENLLAYGTSRNILCGQKNDEVGYLTLFDNGYDLGNPVEWLIKLYNIEEYDTKLGKDIILPVFLVKELIKTLLNSDIQIDITADGATFTEKDTPVEFRRLSAGYIGVITIICDMLDRLSKNQPYITDIKEYRGIVLIDEVELHLHPKWKYNFVKKLRVTFPLIQFIFTTHSPTVILGASKKAVFYKIYKDDGEVCISNQIVNEGYTNNSLISSPLFDLKTITSRDYDKRVSSDDYIYDKIHQVVVKRIENNINIDEEEILKLIDEELDKI